MRYKVIVSERAREMLGVHIRFLAQVNRAAAVELKKRMMDELRSLRELPQRYPFFNDPYIPPNKYHKLSLIWYLVLYQIRDSTVYVDWIIDCREDYHWLIR